MEGVIIIVNNNNDDNNNKVDHIKWYKVHLKHMIRETLVMATFNFV